MSTVAQPVDEAELQEFMGRFVGDFGAAVSSALVVIGEKLGLYRALAEGPATPRELAERTSTDERYVREWLMGQAASGYVELDPDSGSFDLNPVQAMCLADPSSPTYIPGAFLLASAAYRDEPLITEAFRTGAGVGWHEHDHNLFHGCESFFRAGYNAHLVAEWIPALEGMEAKLEAGAKVADLGCGHGASTIIMAQAFPRSRFIGFDYHEASVESARERAHEAGVSDRVAFEVASAQEFPGEGYDFVAVFDALHDMGDPVGAARRVRNALAHDGTWMVVEPFAGDRPEDNINPVGRIFYAASTMVCTPASRNQDVGLALGAQAGEARLTEVIRQGGFGSVRRAAETPFNIVLEARA